MAEPGFLESLGIISVSAAVMVSLGKIVRMPAIVVYLLCGVVLGPVTGWVRMEEGLELVSETGIALLLFLVGLELSISKVKDVGKTALLAGFAQVAGTAVLGFLLAKALGFGMAQAGFLAVTLTFSSTVVVVKLLEEKGEIESLYGRIAVGVLLVQDLVVILLLTFLAGLGGGGGGFDAGVIGWGLAKAFGGMAVLLVVALVAAKWLLPKAFGWAARSPQVLMVWALSWCFLMVLGAHAFHLSLEVGAFLAGMSLAQLPYNGDLRRRVHPLMNFFVAVFFVTLGIRINLDGAMNQAGVTLALSAFILIGKPVMFLVILGVMGYGRKTAFLTGTTLAQTSEFSFILAGLAMAKGLIGGEVMLVAALVGIVTIASSSYMILYSHAIYARILRWGWLGFKILDGRAAVRDQIVHAGEHLEGHVIVVGMNTLGRELVRRLMAKGEQVLAVDTDPRKLEGLPGLSLLGSVGYLSVLEEAGYERAKLLVSALRIEEANDILAYRCGNVETPCAIHVVDFSVVDNLLEMETDYMMMPKVDGVKVQLAMMREMGVLR